MVTHTRSDGPRRNVSVRRPRAFPWNRVILEALDAAHTVVQRMGAHAGRRVVAGRADGYRPWDPEVIGVDTATERAVIRVLERRGVRGTLLSEEAGERPLHTRAASGASEPVYVVMDPFDGSLLYRRGIRAHWFTGVGVHGMDGTARAAGLIDHTTGEIAFADTARAIRLLGPHARPMALQPAATTALDGAFLEAYMMKPPFLYAISTALRPLMERAKFVLPNGGPGGFVDVAAGRIDVYLGWNEALTEVHSTAHIAQRAGCAVSGWDGAAIRFTPDIRAVFNVVCSANTRLHRQVLATLKSLTPPKGLMP